MERRKDFRIGIPRLLNTYTYAPLFNAYFASLGLKSENIIYSDYTTPELYRAGASRGAIDPCYPSKIGIAHVYNLLATKHSKKPLNAIWFPMYDVLHSAPREPDRLKRLPDRDRNTEVVKAAFTKESDIFAENNILYMDPILNLQDEKICADQMFKAWGPVLGLTREENDRAIAVGFKALARVRGRDSPPGARDARSARARRPHRHRHAGPRLSPRSRPEPRDHGGVPEARLSGLFAEHTAHSTKTCLTGSSETRFAPGSSPIRSISATSGRIATPPAPTTKSGPRSLLRAIRIWSRSKSPASSAATTLPIYGVIEGIIEQSGTPYFSFKDLDENKPTGSIRIRVETIDYFLRRYREDIIKRRRIESDIEAQIGSASSDHFATNPEAIRDGSSRRLRFKVTRTTCRMT